MTLVRPRDSPCSVAAVDGKPLLFYLCPEYLSQKSRFDGIQVKCTTLTKQSLQRSKSAAIMGCGPTGRPKVPPGESVKTFCAHWAGHWSPRITPSSPSSPCEHLHPCLQAAVSQSTLPTLLSLLELSDHPSGHTRVTHWV